ncbi:ATP-grasp domain-containing protein [Sphingomonas aerophila]|uniref:Carbamoyl-phosphate synthase large subunit n=1 Tax=Sphingomonas aerophila TaxID=1344948 RepID=A0A7W9BBS4_9SPHN|nr:ATP-grasp domain-containing protein [Sphingomonas aerophila]MBB5714297.1 carbamoyl-phosphate synthase large subunit [Sphingomonas aerophila]
MGGGNGTHRILISSAGRRVALLRCFQAAGRELGIDLRILACDLDPQWSAACLEADAAFATPPAGSDEFVETMLALCERERVALVVPTIDTELIAYAHAAHRFEAIGTHVAIGSPALVEMARDKYETARFLAAAGVTSPRTARAAEIVGDGADWSWPLLAKPRHGSSSRGIAAVSCPSELAALDRQEPYIVQEMLRGREFTVSLYFDREGTLRCAIPHERLRVRAGEVEKGVTIRHPGLEDAARRLAAALPAPRGVKCFQAIMPPDEEPSVFEINARFGGGYPLAHRAGATFARWLLEERFGRQSTATNDWEASVKMLRFDDAVFL